MKSLLKRHIPKPVWRRARKSEKWVRHRACRTLVRMLDFAPNGHVDLMTFVWERKKLTPENVILGYAQGMYPFPEYSGELRWSDIDKHTILPLDTFHIPKSMRSYLNQPKFDIRFDTNFSGVLENCAAPRPDDHGTWITQELIDVYLELHKWGMAHSVEAYQDGELVGGNFGVAVGGMFSGNSMFHKVDNASRVCLIYLVELLRRNGYVLFDTWEKQPHFSFFGATEITRAEYKTKLAKALLTPAAFRIPDEPIVVDHRNYH